MLSHLFIATLWSPAGKGLLFLVSNCDFVTFPSGILGQVWYLIVLSPDLCQLSYSAYVATTSMPLVLRPLQRSYCVLIPPCPHYALLECSKFDNVFHVHENLTILISVSTTLLLRPTSSYCVHSIFQGRSTYVAECEGGIIRFIETLYILNVVLLYIKLYIIQCNNSIGNNNNKVNELHSLFSNFRPWAFFSRIS